MANPQSGYNNPTVLPLVGGLDLQAARFFVSPGSLKESLNYESFGIAGYSVIDGIEPYDGTLPCYLRDWVYATRTTGTGNFLLGENLKVGTNVFGRVVYWTAPLLGYVITDSRYAPKVGDTITGAETAATLVTATSGIRRASVYHADMESFLAARDAIQTAILADKESVFPYVSYAKNVIPHGLHWFNGKLYVTVDHYKVSFDTGTTEILPGDSITFSDGATATVIDVDIDSGSWDTDDATGSLLVTFTDDTKPNSTTTGAVTRTRPNGATATSTVSNAINITEVQVTDSWGAGIYYANYDDDVLPSNTVDYLTTDRRFFPLDMGWTCSFRTDTTCDGTGIPTVKRSSNYQTIYGNADPVSKFATSQTLQTGTGFSVAAPFGTGSSTYNSTDTLSQILGDASDTSWVGYTPNKVGDPQESGYAIVKGFDFSIIPDTAVITGFEVAVRTGIKSGATGSNGKGWVNAELSGTALNGLQRTSQKKHSDLQTTTGPTDWTIGGKSDLWGFDGVSSAALVQALRDNTFGLKLSITSNYTGGSHYETRLFALSLKVYYQIPTDKVYAHDPVTGQDLEVEIPYYFLESGQFAPPTTDLNGSGTLCIYNPTPLDSTGGLGSVASTVQTVGSGWEIRTARDGAGSLIAFTTSQMASQMLPTRQQMEDARKKFVQFNANYYANDNQISFYGASGLTPAYQYDSTYFFFFRTALAAAEDKPSHAAYHRGYMCLGYDMGSVIVSVPGDPTNFDPVQGSTQYATGDRVTNLLSVIGTGLAIFCESSIFVLTGDILSSSSDQNNAVMQVISAYSGAFDYTAIDCGTVIFADYRGVSTIETTNKYGDFEAGRISYKITPFLSGRVNDRYAYQATRQNILFAQAIRNKNQYRLYCADGVIITCALPTQDRGYEFTTQKYVFSNNADCLVPVAMCSGVTKQGVDVIFGTFRILPDDTTNITTPSEPERETFVYSIDRGTKLYSSPIKHYAQINFASLENPIDFDLLRNVRVECLTSNYYNGYVKVASDYEPFNQSKLPLLIEPTDKPVRITKESSYLTAKINGRGTVHALEFGGEHVYPGHILQALCLEYASARTQQGAGPTQTIR